VLWVAKRRSLRLGANSFFQATMKDEHAFFKCLQHKNIGWKSSNETIVFFSDQFRIQILHVSVNIFFQAYVLLFASMVCSMPSRAPLGIMVFGSFAE